MNGCDSGNLASPVLFSRQYLGNEPNRTIDFHASSIEKLP
jgi:hypothetical protein